MQEDVLEQVYQEALEERIIAHYSDVAGASPEATLAPYYSSALAVRVHEGFFGIQYLDYKVLVELLRDELSR